MIGQFIAEWQNGYDIVYGRRWRRTEPCCPPCENYSIDSQIDRR